MRRRQCGLTLIELVASIVIVAITVFGLTLVVSGVVGRSGDPLAEQQANSLAQAYLEEVLLASFCDPDPGIDCPTACLTSACSVCGGPAAGFQEASRNLYDDICDYDGLTDNGATDRGGNPITGLARYSIRVDVVDSGVTLGNPPLDSDSGQVVRVDVTVAHPALDSNINLSGFRANAN